MIVRRRASQAVQTWFAATVALLAAGSASAQAPEARERVLAFQDSLQLIADRAALVRREQDLIRLAVAGRNDPLLHLRLGLLALRIGELGDVRHFDDAAAEFQWATRLQAGWPLAWYGLGLSEYVLGKVRAGDAAAAGGDLAGVAYLARSAAERAISALVRAVGADPDFGEQLYVLALRSRRERDPGRAAIVLDALRRAVNGPGQAAATTWLALGRAEREFGEVPRALSAFRQYLDRTGAHRALGLLELARTQLLMGWPDGVEPYYEGARSNDSLVVAEYRADLEPIASAKELFQFDQSRGDARSAFLKGFWQARDAADFRQSGERIREHYRRLFQARREFPLHLPPRVWNFDRRRIALDDVPLDDRGKILVRHGPPDDRATLQQLGVEPNSSWRYRGLAAGTMGEGEDLMVHFVARQDPDDFRLVESLLDIVDVRGQGGGGETGVGPHIEGGKETRNVDDLVRSRSRLTGAAGLPEGRANARVAWEVAERSKSHADWVLATSTDSYRRAFAWNLRARVEVVTVVPASSGSPDGMVRVVFTLPGETVSPIPVADGVRYDVRVRLLLTDLDGRPVLQRDSVLAIPAPRIVPRDRLIAGSVLWAVPAGRYVSRVLLEQGGSPQAGSVTPPMIVHVARPTADSLAAGDILVLGRSPRVAVAPSVADGFPGSGLSIVSRSESVVLRIEVEGGRAWAALEGEAVLVRRGQDGRVAWARRAPVSGPGTRESVQFILNLPDLAPGDYAVELTVRTPDGRMVRRWRDLTVTAP